VIANQPDWLALPISISVRSGPFLPLLILIWGILIGRLLKYMQERGEPQAKVLQELNELEYELRSLDPKDQTILAKVIDQARRATYREQFDSAKTDIKMIRDRLDVLTKLRTLEDRLEQRVEPIADDVVNKAIETVQSARSAVIQGEDGNARAGIQQVQQLFNTAGVGRGAESTQTQNSIQGVTDSLNALSTNDTGKITTNSQSFINRLQRSLIIISGVSDRAKAEATFWVVRPLLALVLLAGLSAVGLGSLYVEKGTTFGARPFSDYLGLILWGLSADVASRSLSNLSGGSSSKSGT
jgi:Sporulation protein YpjB (SpoYpjB)